MVSVSHRANMKKVLMVLVDCVGSVTPEVDDGEEVTDDENVQTPVCMPSPPIPTLPRKLCTI